MGNELLKAAREWIAAHGAGVMMPRGDEITEAFGDRRFFLASSSFLLNSSEYEPEAIDNVPGRMIPFLAGMEFGLGDQDLAFILKHHGADLSDIAQLKFGKAYTCCLRFQATGESITPSEIHFLYFRVMQTFTHVSDVLNVARRGNPLMRLALLHSKSPSVWADTMITERLSSVYQRAAYLQNISPMDFGEIITQVFEMNDLPNASFPDFFERSGLLNEAVITQRMDRATHWTNLMARLNSGSGFATDLFNYACSITDTRKQKVISNALKSLGSRDDSLDATKTMKTLMTLIPEENYLREVLSSTVLRINLLNGPYDEQEGVLKNHIAYHDVLPRPELSRSKLAKEVRAVKASKFGVEPFFRVRKAFAH